MKGAIAAVGIFATVGTIFFGVASAYAYCDGEAGIALFFVAIVVVTIPCIIGFKRLYKTA